MTSGAGLEQTDPPIVVMLARGLWCTNCEFFEDEDIVAGRCQSCGCDEAAHRMAQVVTQVQP